jgi:Xaa-Pro dipeptidase
VTYDIKKDTLDAWIPPPRSGSTVIYNGSNPTREEIKAKYDFDKVHLTTSLAGYLRKYIQRHQPRKIFLLHPYQAPKTIQFDNGDSHTLKESPFEHTKLKPAMDAARAIKSPFELQLIRKASAITAQAHVNVLRRITYLENESEIEAIFAATCIAQKADQAYGIIAGSGENASTLHYVANNEPLKGRQLVCLDAGCEWKCYASDVTRTFPISGEFTPEAKKIYDIVEKMQEECISMVAPGVSFRDIHLHAHRVATKGLMKLGLLQNGTFEDLYKSGASVAFFPHGLGRK